MELSKKKERKKNKNISGKQFEKDKTFYIKLKEVNSVILL